MGRNGQDTLLWEGKAAAEPQGTPPQSPHSTAWLCPLGPWHSSAWKVSLKRKKHILSKCWPASAANSLVRDIGIIWELDGVNICARQMLGQGGVAGAAEPPSPLHCLQMRHGMPEEGWCNLTHTLTHLLLQGDPSKHPKLPRRGGWNSGDSPWQLAGCTFPLGEYWSNWAQRHRIGLEGLLIPAPTFPAPLHLSVVGSPNILGHYGASPSLSEQLLSSTSQPPPAAPPATKTCLLMPKITLRQKLISHSGISRSVLRC